MKPRTRKEIFMDALAKGIPAPIKPMTREEMLLAKQAEREADKPFGEQTTQTVLMDIITSGSTKYGYGWDAVFNNLTNQMDSYEPYMWLFENTRNPLTISVMFDGVQYDVTGVEYENRNGLYAVIYGDASKVTSSEFTSELPKTDYPFAFYDQGGATPYFYTDDTSKHRIIVSQNETTIKTIDPKYLPEGIGFVLKCTYDPLEQTATCDKTYEDIAAVWNKGLISGCVTFDDGQIEVYSNLTVVNKSEDRFELRFSEVPFGTLYVNSDGTVTAE